MIYRIYSMNLNYKLEGNGKTLVFIHGLSDNLNYWQPLVEHLKNDYQILRYDLRGHGLSEEGYDDITMDVYLEDLLYLLDELNLKMVTLAGLSLGGAIALNFAIKHPERVSSMLLMSTFHKVDGESIVIFKKLKNSLEKGFIEFFDEIIPMVLCPKVIEDNMEALNLIKEEASKTANITAYISAMDVCLNQNVEDKLKDITIPTLIFAGKYDEISPLKIQEDLNNKLNNSEIIIFDNVKHNILIGENIDKISNIVKEFI